MAPEGSYSNRIHGLILSLDSIKSISKQIAKDMLTFYNGDKPGFTPGLLPEPPYFCMLYFLQVCPSHD